MVRSLEQMRAAMRIRRLLSPPHPLIGPNPPSNRWRFGITRDGHPPCYRAVKAFILALQIASCVALYSDSCKVSKDESVAEQGNSETINEWNETRRKQAFPLNENYITRWIGFSTDPRSTCSIYTVIWLRY